MIRNLSESYWYYNIDMISSPNTWINNQWINFKTTIRIMLVKKNAIPEENWYLEKLFE